MPLLNDMHHLTFITADMGRLIAFYERIFGARVLFDLEEDGLRHAGIAVGPHTMLYTFQIPGVEPPGPSRCSNVAASTTSRSTRPARKRSVNSTTASLPRGKRWCGDGYGLRFDFHLHRSGCGEA
jgi:catechol 2,3-dioxygenase-like lactoylglutathione lyase family enzyme